MQICEPMQSLNIRIKSWVTWFTCSWPLHMTMMTLFMTCCLQQHVAHALQHMAQLVALPDRWHSVATWHFALTSLPTLKWHDKDVKQPLNATMFAKTSIAQLIIAKKVIKCFCFQTQFCARLHWILVLSRFSVVTNPLVHSESSMASTWNLSMFA